MFSHPSNWRKCKPREASPPNSRHRNRKSGTTNWRQTASLHIGSRLLLRMSDLNYSAPIPLLVTNQSTQLVNISMNQATFQSNSESMKFANQLISPPCISLISTINISHGPLAWLQGRLHVCVSQHVRHCLTSTSWDPM